MWLQEGGVDSKVGGGARVRLHVDTPLFGVQAEGGKGPLLAQHLALIDELIATIVPRVYPQKDSDLDVSTQSDLPVSSCHHSAVAITQQ